MKLFVTALVLMMSLSACNKNSEYAVTTGDVTVEDLGEDIVQEEDTVVPEEDVLIVEEVESGDVSSEPDVDSEDAEPETLDRDPTSFEKTSFSSSDFFHPEVP